MKKYITLVALTLVLFSCSNETKETTAKNTVSVTVRVSPVNSENNSPFFTVSGKIEAADQITLSTRSSGFIDHIYVNVGRKHA